MNPWHLEPVTIAENVRRGRQWESEKTHCSRNHLYDEVNTYWTPDGHRECRQCRLLAFRRHAPKKRAYLRERRKQAPNNSQEK